MSTPSPVPPVFDLGSHVSQAVLKFLQWRAGLRFSLACLPSALLEACASTVGSYLAQPGLNKAFVHA